MASELLENTIATLRVLRTSDHGAFLDGQTGNTNDDILLHKDQQTSPVAIGAIACYEGRSNWLC